MPSCQPHLKKLNYIFNPTFRLYVLSKSSSLHFKLFYTNIVFVRYEKLLKLFLQMQKMGWCCSTVGPNATCDASIRVLGAQLPFNFVANVPGKSSE